MDRDSESDSGFTFKDTDMSDNEFASSETIDTTTWSPPSISAMVSQKLKQTYIYIYIYGKTNLSTLRCCYLAFWFLTEKVINQSKHSIQNFSGQQRFYALWSAMRKISSAKHQIF